MIGKVIDNKVGKIVISIILGLGLATLFRRVCIGANCIVVKGPPLEDIKGKIFSLNNKCYQYTSVMTSCDNKKSMDLKKIGANDLEK